MKATTRKKLKLTPWFVGVNPLRSRSGVYKKRHAGVEFFLHWDGEKWLQFRDGVLDTPVQAAPWRGVSR